MTNKNYPLYMRVKIAYKKIVNSNGLLNAGHMFVAGALSAAEMFFLHPTCNRKFRENDGYWPTVNLPDKYDYNIFPDIAGSFVGALGSLFLGIKSASYIHQGLENILGERISDGTILPMVGGVFALTNIASSLYESYRKEHIKEWRKKANDKYLEREAKQRLENK